jgi:hypothetical protein
MSSEVDYYRHLVDIMGKTRGARITAAAGLIVKDRFSVLTVATLSIYMLAWSIAAISYPELFTAEHARFYSAIGAVSSVSLLAISLMDLSFARSARAEKFQLNALQISELMRHLERLLVEPTPSIDKMKVAAAKYELYIKQTAINHTSADYFRWLYGSARSTRPIISLMYHLRSLLYASWYYLTGLFFHLVVLALVIGSTAWYTIAIFVPGLPP